MSSLVFKMLDKDMSEMLKTLIEQNKAIIEIMKTQYVKNKTPGHSNLASSQRLTKFFG